MPSPTIGRALTKEEADRGLRVESFLNLANEESITESVVVPLLQTLGFQESLPLAIEIEEWNSAKICG